MNDVLLKPVVKGYRFRPSVERYFGFRAGVELHADFDGIGLTLYLGWIMAFIGWERDYGFEEVTT